MPTCLASQQMKKLNSSAIRNVNILQKMDSKKIPMAFNMAIQQDLKTKTKQKTHHLVACNEFSFQISTYPSRLRSRTQVKQLEAFPVDSRTARLHGERAPCTNISGEFFAARSIWSIVFFLFGQNLKVSKTTDFFRHLNVWQRYQERF